MGLNLTAEKAEQRFRIEIDREVYASLTKHVEAARLSAFQTAAQHTDSPTAKRTMSLLDDVQADLLAAEIVRTTEKDG